jgi:hypothetical protein
MMEKKDTQLRMIVMDSENWCRRNICCAELRRKWISNSSTKRQSGYSRV